MRSTRPELELPLRPAWPSLRDGLIVGEPVLGDGLVYWEAPTLGLVAVDIATGTTRWSFATRRAWAHVSMLDDALVAVPQPGVLVVLDPTTGGVRDVVDLRAMSFYVWAGAGKAQGTVKATPGSVNVPITVGGTVVRAGDIIVEDDVVVLCVPRDDAEAVLAASEARVEREAASREAYQSGHLSLDRIELRSVLADLGVAGAAQQQLQTARQRNIGGPQMALVFLPFTVLQDHETVRYNRLAADLTVKFFQSGALALQAHRRGHVAYRGELPHRAHGRVGQP
jgi:hypothetical protein